MGKHACKLMYQWICVNTHPNITQISVSLDLHEYTYNHHANRGVSTFVWSWGSIFYVYMIHIFYIMYRIQRNEPIPAQKWGDSHLCMSRGLNLTYTISSILVWDRSWWGLVANQLQLICGLTWTGLGLVAPNLGNKKTSCGPVASKLG